MVRTMDEINAERYRLRDDFRVEREASQADDAAGAIKHEVDELDAAAMQVIEMTRRLRVKARGLFTSAQVGDAQTSEAELVSAPLRRRVQELESEVASLNSAYELVRERAGNVEEQLAAYQKNHACTERCRPNAHVAFTGKGMIKDLEEVLTRIREQRDAARADAQRLQQELMLYQDRVAELDERLATAQEDRDRLRGDLGLIKAERDATRARVANLEAREKELGLTAINEQLLTVKAQRDTARSRVAELEDLASSLGEQLDTARTRISNMSGWLDLRNGELASANAQRDAERARVKELNRMLAQRLEEINHLEAARTQAVQANRELIERGVAGVKVRDKVTELERELAVRDQSIQARDSMLAKATAERDDYQAQLIEIRNVVMSDPIEQALTDHQTGKAVLRHVNVLVGALLDVRSTVSVPDPDQPARPRIDQEGRNLLERALSWIGPGHPESRENLIQQIQEYLRNGPTSPTGPPATE